MHNIGVRYRRLSPVTRRGIPAGGADSSQQPAARRLASDFESVGRRRPCPGNADAGVARLGAIHPWHQLQGVVVPHHDERLQPIVDAHQRFTRNPFTGRLHGIGNAGHQTAYFDVPPFGNPNGAEWITRRTTCRTCSSGSRRISLPRNCRNSKYTDRNSYVAFEPRAYRNAKGPN